MVTDGQHVDPPHSEEWRSWRNYDLCEGLVAKESHLYEGLQRHDLHEESWKLCDPPLTERIVELRDPSCRLHLMRGTLWRHKLHEGSWTLREPPLTEVTPL